MKSFFLEKKGFFPYKKDQPYKKDLQQNWRAKNMPELAGRLVYLAFLLLLFLIELMTTRPTRFIRRIFSDKSRENHAVKSG